MASGPKMLARLEPEKTEFETAPARKLCDVCGKMIERITYGLHKKFCKDVQPAEEARLKQCEICGKAVERISYGFHKKNCAKALEKAAARKARGDMPSLVENPTMGTLEAPAAVAEATLGKFEATPLRELSPMSRVSTTAPTSPARLEDVDVGGYPAASPEMKRSSAEDARIWSEIKNLCPVRFFEAPKRAHREAIILMSTPEYGIDREPIMENLLYLTTLAPKGVFCAFDRQGEGLSTFEGDKELFEQGKYTETQWAASYVGRAAGAVQQIYAQNTGFTILRFICIDGGPVTQYEQATLTTTSFRSRIVQEIRKHHHEADIAVETCTLSYKAFCKEVDDKRLLGQMAPLLEDLRSYRFEAVMKEAMDLPITLSTLDNSYWRYMKDSQFGHAKYVRAKTFQMDGFLQLLQERFELMKRMQQQQHIGGQGRRGNSEFDDISAVEDYTRKIDATKACLLGHRLPFSVSTATNE